MSIPIVVHASSRRRRPHPVGARRRHAKHGWKGRNEIATRIARLIQILTRQRYMPPVTTLAQELEVGPRTVYRDLAALEAAYWPLPQAAPIAQEEW